jgi:hypothetical protein
MRKYINIEDAVFILNMRVRMLRDMLILDPDPEIFLGQALNDLEFIGNALEALTGNLLERRQFDQNGEYDHISDLEWQFSRLLTEFALDSSPFAASRFPAIQEKIEQLKNGSAAREQALNESGAGGEQSQTEPVVSSAELSQLLQSF